MDTIPWVLLKAKQRQYGRLYRKVSVDTIPWVLLKENKKEQKIQEKEFQWILFLGSYLKPWPIGNPAKFCSFSGYYSLGLT